MAPDEKKRKRRKAERHGRLAEYAAVVFLRLKGYRILALRYRSPVGEIDVIVRRGDLVAFVEVKMRRNERDAVDAVGHASQHRIRSASNYWISRQSDAHMLVFRYDIVAMQQWKLPRHFVDAF